MKKKEKKIFFQIWIFFEKFEIFWKFWDIFWKCWQFLTLFDNFWQFLIILTIFDNFRQFWQSFNIFDNFLTIFDKFWMFSDLLKVFRFLGSCQSFWKFFHFETFILWLWRRKSNIYILQKYNIHYHEIQTGKVNWGKQLSKSQSSHIKLTPPQKISAMSDTKCLCLPWKFLWPETWHLRHWFHFWQLRTTIWTITLWPLNREWWWQHSQFLRCLKTTCSF